MYLLDETVFAMVNTFYQPTYKKMAFERRWIYI